MAKMQLTQLVPVLNDSLHELRGFESQIIAEDLSNWASIGKQIEDLKLGGLFLNSVMNKIGKTDIVISDVGEIDLGLSRGKMEYGSIYENLYIEPIELTTDKNVWGKEPGDKIEENVYDPFTVDAEYFDERQVFATPIKSVDVKEIVKDSFSNGETLYAFLELCVQVMREAVKSGDIANGLGIIKQAIARVFIANKTTEATYDAVNTVQVVNALAEFNSEMGTSYTLAQARKMPEYLAFKIYLHNKKLGQMTTPLGTKLFNEAGRICRSTKDDIKCIMMEDFRDLVKSRLLPANPGNLEGYVLDGDITYLNAWQTVNDDFSYDSVSDIDVVIDGKTVHVSGVWDFMFDKRGLGYFDEDLMVDSKEVRFGRFVNYQMVKNYSNFYKNTAQKIVIYEA